MPQLTRGFRKAGPSWVGSECSPTWLLPLCCCPRVEVPDFLLHAPPPHRSSWPAQRHPPKPRHRGKPKIRTGDSFWGRNTECEPARRKASEDFRNCKRGHELKSPRTGQKEEGTRKRKRVLLTAPTFSKLSLRAFFLRLRGSAGSGEPRAATEPRGEPERREIRSSRSPSGDASALPHPPPAPQPIGAAAAMIDGPAARSRSAQHWSRGEASVVQVRRSLAKHRKSLG